MPSAPSSSCATNPAPRKNHQPSLARLSSRSRRTQIYQLSTTLLAVVVRQIDADGGIHCGPSADHCSSPSPETEAPPRGGGSELQLKLFGSDYAFDNVTEATPLN